MPNRFYKKFEIVKSEEGYEYYRSPGWIKANFEGIPSKEMVWQQGDRLDAVAEQLYGDPNLWKAIALFNNIGYIFDIKPGDVIYLPIKIKDVLDRI